MSCYNSKTNLWAYDTPDNIAATCSKLIKQDPNWNFKVCYCCCSCFANATPIATPHGEVAIGGIAVGDQVLVGSVDNGSVSFAPAGVTFSQGTNSGEEPAMVYLVYGDEPRALIGSPDQVFMLADGSLSTGGRLVPGQKLMGQDGKPVPIVTVSLGRYTGGIHHIAVNASFDGSIDGHLIVAGGLVVGDFALQLHFPEIAASVKTPNHDNLPLIGTPQYAITHAHVFAAQSGVIYASSEALGTVTHGNFEALRRAVPSYPMGTVSFLTQEQADEVQDKAHQRPAADRSGYSSALAAVNLLSGFFRDIIFDIEWDQSEPNVYAFRQYGQQFVVLSGGLIRTEGMFYEGLTMAVAHAVARLLNQEPTTGGGMSCTGEADFYAFAVISRTIWFGNSWINLVMPALDQIQALFDKISKRGGGNPLDVCEEPSIVCRLQAMRSALGGGSLPTCAGGPAPRPITLEKVTATAADVMLLFSQTITATSGTNTANYQITPAATVTAASVDPEQSFVVHLQVQLDPGDYRVSCSNLLSPYGGVLDPSPATMVFSVGPAPTAASEG